MTDEELAAAFPFGAMLIPQNADIPSARVRVRGQYEDEEQYFTVWLDPHRDLAVHRDLEPFNDGFNAVTASGGKFFMRPLPEENQPTF